MGHELPVITRTPDSEAPSDHKLGHCLASDLQLGSVALSTLKSVGHRIGPGYEAHDHTFSHEAHCGPAKEDGDEEGQSVVEHCNRGTVIITKMDKEAEEEVVVGIKRLQHGGNIEFCKKPLQ